MDAVKIIPGGSVSTRVFSLLILCTWMSHAAAQECDCSCERYDKLRQVMQQYEQQYEQQSQQQEKAGDARGIPPEMMQMGMCAGQCAMAWAQCENPDMDLSGMAQAQQQAQQGRQQTDDEYSGDHAIARERAINQRRIQRQIGETEKNLQGNSNTLPKDQLTGDYLNGMWCSVYGGQETTQWAFTEDGDYRIGVPAGGDFAMQPKVRDLSHFRDRFEVLLERQPDTFTTLHRHGRKNVFTRGACR